jgi:EAL domain-containing protein (putative c-di-GMP-specific phosphodiesterase class I)
LLTVFGVDRAQGYYFSQPIDADKVNSMLSGQPMTAGRLVP